MEWMLADDEPPAPSARSLLRSVGVRVRGVVTVVTDCATPDGVTKVPDAGSTGPLCDVYALTGLAGETQEVWTNQGRRWGGHQLSGAEFVLTVGADRFQVRFPGPATEVQPGSRVTVTGHLEFVGDYEWDDFELSGTRADWLATRVAALPRGDILVELTHPPVD